MALSRAVRIPTPQYWDGPRGARQPDGKRGMVLSDGPEGERWSTPSASKITHNAPAKELMNSRGEPWQPGQKPYDHRTGNPVQNSLADEVRARGIPPRDEGEPPENRSLNPPLSPTPTARDGRSGKGRAENGHTPQLCERVEGLLNPSWVELLMGFPRDWTKV